MINIIYTPEIQKMFRFVGITAERIRQTVNDRHRVFQIGVNPIQLGAIHWFDDEIVFVISAVTKTHQKGNRLQLDEVTVLLPLRLASRLPAGEVDRKMEPVEILRLIAESFGLPVRCSKFHEPALFHKESDWDGETHVEGLTGETFLQGTFSPKTKKCNFVWAFSLNKYKEWYQSNFESRQIIQNYVMPDISTAPSCKGYFIPSDFLKSTASIGGWFDRTGFEKGGLIFRAVAENFIFSLEFNNSSVICTRNNTINTLTTDDLPELSPYLMIGVSWSLSNMSIHLFSGDNHKHSEVNTIPVVPPPSLIRWARQQNLVPTTEYESEEALRTKVYSCLGSIQDKIDSYGAVNPFWDIHYEGKTVLSRNPKKEPDIHPTLGCILSDQMLLSSIEVIPEYHTGIGNLDFAFLGMVKNSGIHTICVEFKNAHSRDIFNGLTTQFPQYMQNKNSKYGAYCVLYFKSDWFNKPNLSIKDLEMKLHEKASKSGNPFVLDNIRVFVFNLSKSISASVH